MSSKNKATTGTMAYASSYFVSSSLTSVYTCISSAFQHSLFPLSASLLLPLIRSVNSSPSSSLLFFCYSAYRRFLLSLLKNFSVFASFSSFFMFHVSLYFVIALHNFLPIRLFFLRFHPNCFVSLLSSRLSSFLSFLSSFLPISRFMVWLTYTSLFLVLDRVPLGSHRLPHPLLLLKGLQRPRGQSLLSSSFSTGNNSSDHR